MLPTHIGLSLVLAMFLPFCARVQDPVVTPATDIAALWKAPDAGLDLYYGPWGSANAPDPLATYTLVEHKHTGVNPGMTVRDDLGREWSVKQAPPNGQPAEGPIEVAVSRVLSGLGYHQPPVYYLPSFQYRDDWGTRIEPGGRFRLKTKALKDRGEWSWQRTPFVGTQPYQGLLVVLMLLNSSDLKNSNNTLYEHRDGDLAEPWFVVRDLGTALGETGRFAPHRGDAARFGASRFITGVDGGLIAFGYRGWHQELVRERIRVADVRWAVGRLQTFSDHQWRDAFRAGGFTPAHAASFLAVIKSRIDQAAIVGAAEAAPE